MLVERRKIAAVFLFEILTVVTEPCKHLGGIHCVQSFRLVDLHARQYGEDADVVIDIHRVMFAPLGEESIPQ